MSMNASRSKGREEGCGKWLTTKGKSTGSIKQNIKQNQLHFRPYATKTLKPIIFEPNVGENKSLKMKQSTMSQFLVEKTSKVKKDESNSNDKYISTSKDKVPVVLFLKKGVSSALTEYESLWGSDSDESDTCQTEENVQKTIQEEKPNILKYLPTVYCKDAQIDSSFKRNDVSTNEEQQDTEKLFPSPKRLRKSKDSMNPGTTARTINSTRNEVQFTEWFENEVDAFIQHRNEGKNVLNKENLSSMSCRYSSSCKPSDSEEESTLIPQFSEWFSEEIKKMDAKELPARS